MENIRINVSEYPQNKGITLFSVKGFIDTTTAPDFEEKFLSALDQNKFKLIVDLKEVEYISSAGWGLFIGQIKHIRNRKGDLVLAGMSPEVSEVFKLLEFDTVLKSFPDVESAVRKSFI